jgi:hypothetical protein
MTLGPANRFVFVDFENVQEVDLDPIREQPVHVTLLLGRNQRKIDLVLAKQLMEFAAQVVLVEVGASGRNALDLTLACYLGRAIERAPDAMFAVVSKDKDFAAMIAHLSANGVKITQSETFTAVPFLRARRLATPAQRANAPKPTSSARKPIGAAPLPADTRRDKLLARLRDPSNRNWPGDEAALRANIRTTLGKETSDAKVNEIMRELRESGALTIDSNGDVHYAAKL